ncbi:MAG: amidase, partial [Betaproteobacteria bacterium]|nr:amidase [Betaproteobacteria bacterium]
MTPTPTTLTSLTATELLQGYRARQFSVVDATRAFLNRIERLNPSLNAFCLIDEAATLEQARKSEARWTKCEGRSALDGVRGWALQRPTP